MVLEKNNVLFNKIIQNYEKDDSVCLYGGLSGKALLIALIYLTTSEDKYYELLMESIDKINSTIEEGSISPFLSNGLAGVGLLYNYLDGKDILDAQQFLESVDIHLFDSMISLFQDEKNSSDQMNGSLGIGLYFLNRKHNEAIEVLLDYIFKNKVETEHHCYWIRNQQFSLNDEVGQSIDFGLAHGNMGKIYILMKSIELKIRKDECVFLLKKCIKYYMDNQQNFEEVGSDFPSMKTKNDESLLQKSRLAWCYGDLTIWYTLYKASVLINDTYVEQHSIKRLINSLKRQNYNDTFLKEPGFCHGFIGVSYIYFKLWKMTGIDEFKTGHEYWLERVNTFTEENKDYLLEPEGTEEMKSHSGLLEGTVGVALCMLTFSNPEIEGWSSLLMLD
ncbi:lanthionine synthetase LanC family protein [Flammeovirga aprica]|uniref:Lanthionine synthetase C family protein n=1 Tax=Flammeovirga aprica JL-4 TaxID=694437 RepID=A0A7X9P069_9BACT|nr:lanthionine synthetase LanC family protein [Flammeovirga aprica]NME66793.1 hypothetical protein [Flammeovirga aprica JL-4]